MHLQSSFTQFVIITAASSTVLAAHPGHQAQALHQSLHQHAGKHHHGPPTGSTPHPHPGGSSAPQEHQPLPRSFDPNELVNQIKSSLGSVYKLKDWKTWLPVSHFGSFKGTPKHEAKGRAAKGSKVWNPALVPKPGSVVVTSHKWKSGQGNRGYNGNGRNTLVTNVTPNASSNTGSTASGTGAASPSSVAQSSSAQSSTDQSAVAQSSAAELSTVQPSTSQSSVVPSSATAQSTTARSTTSQSPTTQPSAIQSSVAQSSSTAAIPTAKTLAASTASTTSCTNPETHKEWRNMSDDEKTQFINAVKCLLGKPASAGFSGPTNRYEDLVYVHQQLVGTVHMVAQFLPYHRYYRAVFESMLRQECSFNGPMPWWDETKDAGHFGTSPVFTPQWFGSIPQASNGNAPCVSDGAFSQVQLHIGPGSRIGAHCLARVLDESLTANCDQDYINTCNSYQNYTDMESCMEGGPHAYGHNGIGAVMSDVAASPADPAFWMHHGFVDHTWNAWQRASWGDRAYQIGGYSTQAGAARNSGPVLTLDHQLSSMGIRPNVTVQDVMDIAGGYLCYRYDY